VFNILLRIKQRTKLVIYGVVQKNQATGHSESKRWQTFHGGSVATGLRYGEIFNDTVTSTVYHGERIPKIGRRLVKLSARTERHLFDCRFFCNTLRTTSRRTSLVDRLCTASPTIHWSSLTLCHTEPSCTDSLDVDLLSRSTAGFDDARLHEGPAAMLASGTCSQVITNNTSIFQINLISPASPLVIFPNLFLKRKPSGINGTRF